MISEEKLKQIESYDECVECGSLADNDLCREMIDEIRRLREALHGLLSNISLDWYAQQFGRDETPRGAESGIVSKIHNVETVQRIRVALETARQALGIEK